MNTSDVVHFGTELGQAMRLLSDQSESVIKGIVQHFIHLSSLRELDKKPCVKLQTEFILSPTSFNMTCTHWNLLSQSFHSG